MKKIIPIFCFVLILMTGSVTADTGIAANHRDAIHKAMEKHIQTVTELNGNGKFPVYDPESRSILQLDFDKLHDSVEIKGRKFPYFVTCADFKDSASGDKYDLDFLVSENYGVVATLIHSKNGKYTDYNIH
jgi:hypothetical protein